VVVVGGRVVVVGGAVVVGSVGAAEGRRAAVRTGWGDEEEVVAECQPTPAVARRPAIAAAAHHRRVALMQGPSARAAED
jgi:hypothetical protein